MKLATCKGPEKHHLWCCRENTPRQWYRYAVDSHRYKKNKTKKVLRWPIFVKSSSAQSAFLKIASITLSISITVPCLVSKYNNKQSSGWKCRASAFWNYILFDAHTWVIRLDILQCNPPGMSVCECVWEINRDAVYAGGGELAVQTRTVCCLQVSVLDTFKIKDIHQC